MKRLLARATLAVDGGGGGGDREACGEPCVASDVQRLFADLTHATEDDVLNLAWIDARALHDLFQDQRA